VSTCKLCSLLALPDLGAELPNLVLETATAAVVLNRRPVAPGHVTIMLKRHHDHTSEMRDSDWAGIGTLSGRIASFLEQRYQPARVVFLGDGKKSAHLHLHLVPEPAAGFSVGDAVADLNLAVRPATLPDDDLTTLLPALRLALR
jgi:diadenosine tetraphosphate (Ap4A) HIT family hydrolase